MRNDHQSADRSRTGTAASAANGPRRGRGVSRYAPTALIGLLLLAACAPEQQDAAPNAASESESSEAQALIDEAIQAHGGNVLENAVMEFDFRGDHYTVRQESGQFRYERAYTDSTGARVQEVLSNDSLYRRVDGARVTLSEEERRGMETTVNSVVYFALLPFPLSDPAVQARALSADTLEGQAYDVVEVTFQEEGGGRDYEDRFVYWFHPETRVMDYLAYYYHTDGSGSRFRKAVNPRTVEGVRVADYVNFTADSTADTLGTAVEHYPALLRDDALRTFSRIETENVTVRPLE